MPSKCLGGEGYLEQYFKGFIKLVGVTEKICVVKNTYLFPLSCRCLTGNVCQGCFTLSPFLLPSVTLVLVLSEIAC